MTVPREDWSGPRPLALGTPVAALAVLAIVLAAVLVLALWREVDIPALVAAHYVDLMAGALPVQVESSDAGDLAPALAQRGLAFTPRIASLEPEFTLLGGGTHSLSDRPAAFWYYRNPRSDMVLAEAFTASLADLGRPAEVRDEPPLRLHVFRKTTQTIVFWQEDGEVYGVTSTFPGERAVALARRLAAPAEPQE